MIIFFLPIFCLLSIKVWKFIKKERIFFCIRLSISNCTTKNYDRNVYIWQGFCAWGVGLWKIKWEKINWNKEHILNVIRLFLKDYKNVYKHHMISNRYIPSKLNMIKKNMPIADGYISLYLFLNKMYSVFPTISRVRNRGLDGSGENCSCVAENIYNDQVIYSGEDI